MITKIKGSRSWYQMKVKFLPEGIHMKNESPITYQSKVMTKVKVFKKKVKLQGQ
jgi:hypothetical protein